MQMLTPVILSMFLLLYIIGYDCDSILSLHCQDADFMLLLFNISQTETVIIIHALCNIPTQNFSCQSR